MNSLGENLGKLAQVVARVMAGPLKALLVLAGGVVAVVAVLAAVLVLREDSPGIVGTVITVAIPVLLVIPILVLASRRRRWLSATEDLGTEHSVITGRTSMTSESSSSTELTPADLTERVEENMRGREGEEDVQALFDAVTESRAPASDRGAGAGLTRAMSRGRLGPIGYALSRLERAQRALLTAAGGPVAAPYLREDLRITAAALIGTMLAFPLGVLAAIVLALVLLTQ